MTASFLVDLRPLRESRPFRLYWTGNTLSLFGSQLGSFALTYYVWEITKNPALVGLLGLVTALPTIAFALAGGTVADSMDRRRLTLWTTFGQIVVSALITLLVMFQVQTLGLILPLIFLASACSAVGAPARRTFAPRLLSKEQLPAGLALNHIAFQSSLLLGPALAGVIIARWGVATCFLVDTLTFVASLIGVASLPSMLPASTPAKAGLAAIRQAAGYVTRRPILSGALLSDLCATVLAMPIALFPVLNEQKFGGSPQTLGLFLSALGVGGLIASILSGRTTRSRRPGHFMLMAGVVWGLALAGAGLSNSLVLTLVLVALAGAADTLSVISRGTMVQTVTDDDYRGRVSAMEHVVGVAGPQLGNFRAGLIASVSSGGAALVTGGLMCVLGLALIARLMPSLQRHELSSQTPR